MGSIGYRYLCGLLAEALSGVIEQGLPFGCQMRPGSLSWVVLLYLLTRHINIKFLLHRL